MKQPRIEQVSLEKDIQFVRGMELNFEQKQFPEATQKVCQMVRIPIPTVIRINR